MPFPSWLVGTQIIGISKFMTCSTSSRSPCLLCEELMSKIYETSFALKAQDHSVPQLNPNTAQPTQHDTPFHCTLTCCAIQLCGYTFKIPVWQVGSTQNHCAPEMIGDRKSFWNQKSSLRVSNTKSHGSCRGFLCFLTTKCLDPWRFFINFIGFIACFTSLGPPCESPILDFLKESMFFEGHNGPWRSGVGLNQKN